MFGIPLFIALGLLSALGALGVHFLPFKGLIPLETVWYVVITFFICRMTLQMVTIYLHRTLAHSALVLAPPLTAFYELWCWLFTGMDPCEWAKVHRTHHAEVETDLDPHSPVHYGLANVLFNGVDLYRKAVPLASDNRIRDLKYSWIGKHLYWRFSTLGLIISLVALIVCFGPAGLIMGSIAMACIPVLAAGVINGIGHAWGYRNFQTQNHRGRFEDASTNIVPIAWLVFGEELHNNHHAFATSAKFSIKRGEVDWGWVWICIYKNLGLLKVKRAVYRARANVQNPVRGRDGRTYECVQLE